MSSAKHDELVRTMPYKGLPGWAPKGGAEMEYTAEEEAYSEAAYYECADPAGVRYAECAIKAAWYHGIDSWRSDAWRRATLSALHYLELWSDVRGEEENRLRGYTQFLV